MTRVRPLSLATLLLSVSLAANPLITPPRLLLGPGDGPAPEAQASPALVATNDGFLVAWTTNSDVGRSVLHAQRFSLEGDPLSPFPVRIADNCEAVGAIASGSGYLVYANCRVGFTTPTWVVAARLSHEGELLATTQVAGVASIRNVASNGIEAVALAETRPYGWALLRLGQDGLPAGKISLWEADSASSSFVTPTAAGWAAFRTVAAGGVASLYRTPVRGDVVGAPEFLGPVQFDTRPTQATNGSSLLITWLAREYTAGTIIQRVFYLLLDGDGRLTAAPTVVATATAIRGAVSESFSSPAGFWDGTQYVVVWSHFDGLGINEIRAQPIAAASPPVVLERYVTQRYVYASSPVAASGALKTLLVWLTQKEGPRRDGLPSPNDLVGRTFSSYGSLLDAPTKILARGLAYEKNPRLSVDAEQTFAVWREGDDSFGVIRGQIPGRSGRFTISDGVWTAESPRVERVGGVYLVAWREDLWMVENVARYRILARRFDPAGRPLELAPIVLDEGEALGTTGGLKNSLDLATDGSQFLVVWSSGNAEMRAVRISQEGRADRTRLVLAAADAAYHELPTVEWTGREFLAIWRESAGVPGSLTRSGLQYARYARVLPDGSIRAAGRLADPLERGSSAPFASASNASETLVSWIPGSRSGGDSCVYAQLFSLDGVSKGTARRVRCKVTERSLVFPSIDVAWDGEEWWIVTTDADQDGNAVVTPLARPSEAVELEPSLVRDATITRGPSGLVIAYSRWSDDDLAWRTYVRSIVRPGRTQSIGK